MVTGGDRHRETERSHILLVTGINPEITWEGIHTEGKFYWGAFWRLARKKMDFLFSSCVIVNDYS